MRTALLAAAACTLLSACVTYHVRPTPGLVALGQKANVGPLIVTPLAIVEDSRCPTDTQCVWAGRVRIDAAINDERHELTLGQTAAVAGGTLVLAEVRPAKVADIVVGPTDYRFRFEYR